MRPHHLRAAAGSSGGIVSTNMMYYDFGNSNSHTPNSNRLYALKPDGTNWDNLGTSSPYSFSINGSNTSSWQSTKGGHISLDYYQIGSNYYPAHLYTVGNQQFPTTFGNGPFSLELYHGGIHIPNPNYVTHNIELVSQDLFQIVWNPLQFLQQYADLTIDHYSNHLKLRGIGWTGSTATNSSPYIDYESSQTYSSFPTPWEQIVLVRENTNTNGMKIYRNGTLISTFTNSIDYNSQGSLATQYQLTMYKMKGSIGLFRVYTGTALTQSEITTHYNIEKPRFGLP